MNLNQICRFVRSKNTALLQLGLLQLGGVRRLTLLSAALLMAGSVSQVSGQVCEPCQLAPVETYRIAPQRVIENQEVTTYKPVAETSTQKRQITEYKPVVRTEQRERRYSVLKPVIETEYQTRRKTVLEPVTETVMQQTERQVTEYVEETGYREVQEVIPRTVEETQMRERQVVVRKPVVETQYRQTPVTTYKPVTTYQQQLVNQGAVVNQLVTQPGYDRNRLRYLSGTNYTDPVTGQQVYRRPGFYWVNEGQSGAAAIVPTYVNNYQIQQIPQTSYVPETTMNTEAVEVTKYVDEVVTEKVPVTVRKVENEVVTRRVPYSYKTPVTKTVVESVPVTKTTYQERVIEQEVPVQRTTLQRVEKVEPYEVQIKEFQPVTRTEEVPVTENRLVPVKEIRPVEKTVYYRQRLDLNGNVISSMPVDSYGNPIVEAPVSGSSSFSGGVISGYQSDRLLSIGQGSTLNSVVSDEKVESASKASEAAEPADESPMLRLLKPLLNDSLVDPSEVEVQPIELEPKSTIIGT